MGQDVFDRSDGDHDEGEGGFGFVEAVGPGGDELHPSVESFVACVVHTETDRGDEDFAVYADCSGKGDEEFEAAA